MADKSFEQLDREERARLAAMAQAGVFEPSAPLGRALQIAERIWQRDNGGTRNVMVAFRGGFSESNTRRHVKLMRDVSGLYVRLGKRGAMKRYLRDMAGARIVDAEREIAVFFEST